MFLISNPRTGNPDLMRTIAFGVTLVIIIQYILSWLPVMWEGVTVAFNITDASWLLGISYGGYSVRKMTDAKQDENKNRKS